MWVPRLASELTEKELDAILLNVCGGRGSLAAVLLVNVWSVTKVKDVYILAYPTSHTPSRVWSPFPTVLPAVTTRAQRSR